MNSETIAHRKTLVRILADNSFLDFNNLRLSIVFETIKLLKYHSKFN